jgi:hypothetical protein
VNEGERWPITAMVIGGALVFVVVAMALGHHLD